MNKKILFIGLTTVDIQYFVDEFPLPNQKLKTEPPHIYVGGPAANAAITCSFLNGKADLITCIGENAFSHFIKDDFIQNNICVFDFAENKSFSPIIASIITTIKNSDRSVISHFPAKTEYDNLAVQEFGISDYQLVMTDGFYPAIALPVCRIAHEQGIPVILDGGSWKPGIEEILSFTDVAICSEQFLPPGCNSIIDVIHYLSQKSISNSAITRGEKSIIWSDSKNIHEIEVSKTKSIDSLGAGDIFHGAFTYFYSINGDFQESLTRASTVASYSTRYKGTREWMKHIINQTVT